jgi:hypothetical protein
VRLLSLCIPEQQETWEIMAFCAAHAHAAWRRATGTMRRLRWTCSGRTLTTRPMRPSMRYAADYPSCMQFRLAIEASRRRTLPPLPFAR